MRDAMGFLGDVIEQNRAGAARGIYSVCSANRLVLEACFLQALKDGNPILIEATCNQVNQDGGYTGMVPAGFRDYVHAIARDLGYPIERIMLGGDHLGPSPWRGEPVAAAMDRAATMVEAYVDAGFGKIHLDASMPCAGDPTPLAPAAIAGRAARLAAAAEAAAARRPGAPRPVYVIGTEVPTPGGAHEAIDRLAVTRAEDVDRTIELHRTAFASLGLTDAWRRVMAVVVQPGVEFGHAKVVDFAREAARELAARIEDFDGLVFEAHSTDYQIAGALRALVEDHFAILKVGPELTFVMREAVFALAAIEAEWIEEDKRSGVRDALDQAMLRDPRHWQGYYPGTPAEQRFARAYSLSDRCRYYWPDPAVAAALDALLANLAASPPPLPLVSQYLPHQHAAIRAGEIPNEPRAMIHHKVMETAARYAWACGHGGFPAGVKPRRP